jgi:hypothetical protein
MQLVALGEGQVGMGVDVGCGELDGVLRRWAAGVAVGPPISSGVGDREAEVQPAAEETSKRNANKP